jgi:hypothetical protein
MAKIDYSHMGTAWQAEFDAGKFATAEELGSEEEISIWLGNIGKPGEHCCEECIDEAGGPDSGEDDDLECGDTRGKWEYGGEEYTLLTSCESCHCITSQARSSVFNRAYQVGEIRELEADG